MILEHRTVQVYVSFLNGSIVKITGAREFFFNALFYEDMNLVK